MINELLDVSINTMIGLLPAMINYNNKQINREFRTIIKNKKMTVDVSSNNVHAHNGDFDILTVGGLTVLFDNLSSTQEKISALDSSMQYAFKHLYDGTLSSMSYSSSAVNEANTLDTNSDEYDFSSFFSTSGKAIIKGVTIDNIYKKRIYRIIDGLKINLNIGTIVVGGKLKMMIYHDHIDTSGSATIAQRVYVTIVNGSDKNSIHQYGSASTINIGSSI